MYNNFALFYDALTTNVNYKKRTDYLCKIFKKHDSLPTLLLDVACGTGSFSVEFAKKGVDVIGADISDTMLSVARQKALEQNLNILFLNQSAADLELYGTVNGAVCCLDSINHITDYSELCQSFAKISLFLEPGRLFVFDVNSLYKHSTVLANNTFIYETDNLFCSWQNKFIKQKNSTQITLDFFYNNGQNYNRFTEIFFERAYTGAQIEKALKKAGLKIEAIYGENTFVSPKNESERIIYVTRKV